MADVATVSSPTEASADSKHKRSVSSAVAGVYNAEMIEAEGKDIVPAKEIQKLNWKINTSPMTIEEKDVLKKFATSPPMSKLDLRFPLGLTVTVRNKKGITVKDCFDVLWKQFRKKADDELDLPILAGFHFDKEDYGCGALLVVLKKESDAPQGKKKK
ncbi:hypothetical protein DFH27DRAFT_542380 [Peziza echinospora]|nr:hypothetical protein DFH27DRAFT_542380 [Peziza echinospora]